MQIKRLLDDREVFERCLRGVWEVFVGDRLFDAQGAPMRL